MEEWRDVKCTQNFLQVSNTGKARRKPRPLIYKDGRKGTLPAAYLRCTIGSNGYSYISFGGKKFAMHRIVAETFLDEPVEKFAKQTVNHKNGIKTDNRPENLEWATYSKNNNHARNLGLNAQHGENTNFSKYTDQFIDAVRNVYSEYKPTYEKLGKMFGLTGCHARQIVKFETRKKKTLFL
jgi:hypothetical protein